MISAIIWLVAFLITWVVGLMTTATLVYGDVASTEWRPRVTSNLQVWYSTTVIYEFFVDVSTDFVYRKSSDAGATWSASTTLIAGTVVDVGIYYERWHNTSNSPIVHVVGHKDTGTRGLYYNNIDLSSDTKQTTSGTLVLSLGAEPVGGPTAIGMSTSGNIIITHRANNCLKSTNGGTSFSSITGFGAALRDSVTVWPDASSGDTADMIAIWRDFDVTNLYCVQWDNSANAWGSPVLMESAHDGGGLTLTSAYRRTNGAVLVAALSPGGGTGVAQTIKTWSVLGTASVTAKTDVLTSTTGVNHVALQIAASGDVYCAYGRDPTAVSVATFVFYKKSTDTMTTWGAETAYSTSSAHTLDGIYADPSPNVNLFMPAYLFTVAAPNGSDLYVEIPAVSPTVGVLGGALVTTFTLSGTLSGGVPASPPIVIKCKPIAVGQVVNFSVRARG